MTEVYGEGLSPMERIDAMGQAEDEAENLQQDGDEWDVDPVADVPSAGEGALEVSNPFVLMDYGQEFDEPDEEDPVKPTNPVVSDQGFIPGMREGRGPDAADRPRMARSPGRGSSPQPGNQTYSGNVGRLMNFSKGMLGTPYVWAGESRLGVDCSGFTKMAFARIGINLPHLSAAQGRMGAAVSLRNLKPGDLLFWDTGSRNDGAEHVAIYAGKGMMYEAQSVGGKVMYTRIRTKGMWARRIIGNNPKASAKKYTAGGSKTPSGGHWITRSYI